MKPLSFDETNTFCISLENHPTRWEKMRNRFQICGLQVTRWPASTKDTLVDTFAHYLNDGQKGCAQSHINIYRHMLQNDLPYAFILEDDACFDLSFSERLEDCWRTIDDENWDLIVLNGSEPIHPPFQWVLQTEQYLTAGYIISRKGATQILNQYHDCFYSSDWMTTRLQLHGHSYGYFPWPIIQEGKDSNIGQQFEADHEKVLRCLGEIQYSLQNYVI